MSLRRALATALLGGTVLLGGISFSSAPAQAQFRSCRAAYWHEKRDLQRDVRVYGYYSRHARHEARELRRIERRCGYY